MHLKMSSAKMAAFLSIFCLNILMYTWYERWQVKSLDLYLHRVVGILPSTYVILGVSQNFPQFISHID